MKFIKQFFSKQPKPVQILGLQHSGTGAIYKYLKKNGVEVYDHLKHIPVDKHSFDNFYRLGETTNNQILPNSLSDTYVVCMTRNFFDWSRSFFNLPHNLNYHKEHTKIIDNFILCPYVTRLEMRAYSGLDRERRNLVAWRNFKYNCYLNLKKMGVNPLFIRYEDLLLSPNATIKKISKHIGHNLNYPFEVKDEKILQSIYLNDKPHKLRKDTVEKIFTTLNIKQEKKLGYNYANKWAA